MASISSNLIDFLKRFDELVTSKTIQQHELEVPQDLWRDELGRLRVWSGNIGAHQSGRSSLDYRLRDASNVRDQILRLLKGLQGAFDDLEAVSQEPEGVASSVEDESGLDEIYGTEVQQIFKGIVNTIDCLFQMSMAIRRPTQHDQYMGITKADSTPFEFYDRQHVDNKYPKADKEVVNRLGVAISRRRAALRHRERHHAKLSQGLNSGLDYEPETGSAILSETVATKFIETQQVLFDETASNSGASLTSYAQTLLESNDKVGVPSAPQESAEEKPFQCPYCFFIITIRDKRSWARHVFNDLMPYVCVFPDCSTPAMLYASRREWYYHLQTSHSIQSERDAISLCPLCHEEFTNAIRVDRHLGRHLEELALFALPRTDRDEEGDSGADAESAQYTDVPHSNQSDHEAAEWYEYQEEAAKDDAEHSEALERLEKLTLEERAERELRESTIASDRNPSPSRDSEPGKEPWGHGPTLPHPHREPRGHGPTLSHRDREPWGHGPSLPHPHREPRGHGPTLPHRDREPWGHGPSLPYTDGIEPWGH